MGHRWCTVAPVGRLVASWRVHLTTAAVAVVAPVALAAPAAAAPGTVGTAVSAGTTVTARLPPVVQLARPQVIAHRGASGYRPEHTLAAYRLAVHMDADYIEPDLVSTKDGVLVDRHENELSDTTDVEDHPEFAQRRRTKTVDGVSVTGWFSEDFTLAELETLRAQERLPLLRPANARYDGRYVVPTFERVLDLVRRQSRLQGRTIGVIPEIKHSSYFRSIGLPMEGKVVAALRSHGLDTRSAKVMIQSFEVGNLKRLDSRTPVRLVQLVEQAGAPYDLRTSGDPRTYADLIRPRGLRFVSGYADAIGAPKDLVIPRDENERLTQPTSLTQDAHQQGLRVLVFTFRAENAFLPTEYRSSSDPAERGDLAAEVTRFLTAGVDGFFTDFPDIGSAARNAYLDAS